MESDAPGRSASGNGSVWSAVGYLSAGNGIRAGAVGNQKGQRTGKLIDPEAEQEGSAGGVDREGENAGKRGGKHRDGHTDTEHSADERQGKCGAGTCVSFADQEADLVQNGKEERYQCNLERELDGTVDRAVK